MELKGVFTALVTPFSGGFVDYGKLKALVDKQIAAGVDGLVPVGTTGESPTLAVDEHLKVVETVVSRAAGRCRVIAGTGANATTEAIELTIRAKKIGADASLQVTPYYNKPTQEGLYRHFSAVADEAGLPVVLYNIPGRSCVSIDLDTVKRLAANPLIVAVKEAGGSVERVVQTRAVCDLTILSGDDPLTIAMMREGASGVISVASNLIPAAVVEMVHAMLAGDTAKAEADSAKYERLFKAMFIETNPIPIKAAMAIRGDIEEEYRLPICPISDENRVELKKILSEYEII